MTTGEIVSIVYKPGHDSSREIDHYLRVPLEQASLKAGYGIEGDRKGGHPTRQLNVMSQEALAVLCDQGFCVGPGEMGEQIVVKGLDVGALQVGDRIHLGGEAWIEVTGNREGCERFEHIQGFPREQAAGRMGIMAKVIASGQIAVGDSVSTGDE